MTEERDRAGAGETFVVSSEVTISPESGQQFEQAFRDRLHLVEAAPGSQRLEVWQDIHLPGVFQMGPGGTTWRPVATACGRTRTVDRTLESRPNPNAPTAPVCAGTSVYPT